MAGKLRAAAAKGEMLFVTSNAEAPVNADPALIEFFTANGYTVTLFATPGTTPDDLRAAAVGKKVVLISETIGSTSVLDPAGDGTGVFSLKGTDVPVVSFEAYMWDNADWVKRTADGSNDFTQWGNTSRTEVADTPINDGRDSLYIRKADHPIAKGLTGKVQIYTELYSFNFGLPSADADVIASVQPDGSFPSLFVYEKGDKLADGSIAPNKRIGLFLGQNAAPDFNTVLDFANLTDAGAQLLLQTLDYAAGVLGGTAPPPAVAPAVTAQPRTQTIATGASVTLFVTATGDAPLSYQWKLNGADIPGATAAALTVNNAEAANAGAYTVVVTNPAGSITSEPAILTVTAPPPPPPAVAPAVTAQPRTQTIATGASVTLFVTATGDAPLSYQWKLNGADIPGATAAALTVNNAEAANAGAYTVVVTNPAGSITSEPATLTVTAPPPPPPAGLLADNGFRPANDGFKFENYGKAEGVINLTPAELQRMFGDRVFATANATEKILTPAAQKWMEETSDSMNGGHCEGMAVVSLLIYAKNLEAGNFGAPRTVDLNLEGNPVLQREIAYWWATQVVDPTRSTEIFGTPTEVLDRLIEALKPGAKETYTVGVRQEGKGGHAVTPYAVEDKGGGIVDVLVYDNNHPNKERRLTVDRNKNTWSFSLSTNPAEPESVWAGDAATRSFSLSPSSPRLQTQAAPFLEDTAKPVGLNALHQAAPRYNEIWVDGNGVKILLSDPQGNRYGYEAGKFYREMPGVTHRMLKSGDELWKDSPSPTYYVPVGRPFTLTLDGGVVQKMTDTSVTMIGPGYQLSIEDIHLDPNQKDTIVFAPDGKSLSYKTSSNESPEISVGFETPGADFDFTVKGVDIEADSTLTIRLDKAKNTLSISTTGNDQTGTYALSMGRFDLDNAQYFDHDEIELGPKDTATVDFGKWAGNKATMPLLIDRDSNGTVDETIQLTDEEKVVVAGGPKLSAQAVTGGKIKVSWPASAADFILEANTTLSSTGWTAVPANQLASEGANKVFTESGSGITRFYRLRKN